MSFYHTFQEFLGELHILQGPIALDGKFVACEMGLQPGTRKLESTIRKRYFFTHWLEAFELKKVQKKHHFLEVPDQQV